jgi:glycosyltransferase involved in cell wall biosynthesis
MRALRVLQVIDSLEMGGAEQLLVTLARHTDRDRCALRVCSLRALDEGSPIVLALRSLQIPVYEIGAPHGHNPVHVSRFARLMWRDRIDVVHAHLPYATTIGILACKLVGRPIVATLHSMSDARPASTSLKHAVKASALRWGADVVVAVSSEVSSAAVERLRLPARKLRIIPNAIDIRPFTGVSREHVQACRDEFLGDGPGPLIVSVGSLRPAKGHTCLVEATPRVLEAFPTARVVIVGGSGASEPHIRSRIAALGLDERVLLAGPRSDVPELLTAADLVALPSLSEGLPLVVLEAMAAARPVIATTVGGIPGVLRDGVEGRLVPPGDPSALAAAVCELLARPAVADQLGKAARERMLATSGVDVWSERLHSIYYQLALGAV